MNKQPDPPATPPTPPIVEPFLVDAPSHTLGCRCETCHELEPTP